MIYKGVDYSDSNRITDRRRKPPGVRKIWQVGKVWELHEEIARRVLLGQKNTQIAKAISCSPQTVSNVRNSPVVQDKLAVMRGARDAYTIDIARDIQEFAPEALSLLKNVVKGVGSGANADVSLRARTSESMLDRAGFGAIKKEARVVQHLTSEEITAIKERAFGPQSPVINAEFKEAG